MKQIRAAPWVTPAQLEELGYHIVGFSDYYAEEARTAAPTGGAKAAKTSISRRRAAE